MAGVDIELEKLEGVSLRQHIAQAKPDFRWYRYVELIIDRMQQFADGTLLHKIPDSPLDGTVVNKLYISMKPQLGKSLYVQMFLSWMMRTHPGLPVGSAMFDLKVVRRFSRFVRQFYVAAGGTLVGTNIENWFTFEGSEFWCVSTGSGTNSRPAGVLVGDDLVKGHPESANPALFREHHDWLASQWLERDSPHGHPKLAGRLLELTIGSEWGLTDIRAYWLSLGGWYVIKLPLVYDPIKWPVEVKVGPFPLDNMEQPDKPWIAPNCTLEPDWREPGEALEPTVPKMTVDYFNSKRAKYGGPFSEESISAVYQVCPSPTGGGGVFHPIWFTKIDAMPPPASRLRTARAHDWASTLRAGHWSANAKTTHTRDSKYAILHGSRAKLDPQGVNWLVAALMILDGPLCDIVFPEAKGEGKLTVHGFVTYLRTVAEWAGVQCPAIRTAPVGTKRPPKDPRSAKWYRWAEGALSLRSVAKPTTWDEEKLEVSIPGSYSMVMAPWKPRMRGIIRDFEKRAEAHQDLLEIEKFGLAATGQLPPAEMKALGFSTDTWQFAGREDLKGVNAFGGGIDDWIDALADVHDYLARPILEMGAG